MNYWLHRITGGDNAWPLSVELFKKGYISIGWLDFSTENYLSMIRSGVEGFDKMMDEQGYGRPRNRWNLWRFVNEMSEGDIVVMPFPYSFAICKISDNKVFTNESIDPELLVDRDGNRVTFEEDGYLHNSNGDLIDLGFYRKVEVVEKEIPREYADQALYSRMKIRQTNADICDLAGSINDAVEAFRKGKPVNLRESVMESAAPLILEKIRGLQNDSKFESLVEWYLKSLGASRVETPWRGESPSEAGDADKVAYFDNIGFAIMVQIKKHSGITDDWAVTQIKAYSTNHNFGEYSTALWVVCSGDGVSEEACGLAQENGVRLIDGPQFARMILDAGLDGLEL